MKRLLSVLGLLIVGCLGVKGQRQDTIYQTLASNYISPNVNGDTWGPVTNIGQAFHQAYINVTAQPTHTCHSGSTAENSTLAINFYTQIPGQALTIVQNYTKTYQSAGGTALQETISAVINHPYVYIVVNGIDIVNCQYTLVYTGSLYPGTVLAQPGTPLYFSFNTSGSHTITTVDPGYISYTIPSLVLSNATAGQTVTFECGTTPLIVFNNLAAGQVVILPFIDSAKPYFSCTNGNLNVVLSNSSEIDFNMGFGFE